MSQPVSDHCVFRVVVVVACYFIIPRFSHWVLVLTSDWGWNAVEASLRLRNEKSCGKEGLALESR